MAKTCSVEGCEYDAFCIDRNTREPYCRNHSYLRTDKTYKKASKRSAKKISEDDVYYPKKDEFLENHKRCQVRKEGVCTRKATDVHHTEYRTGTRYLDEETWLASCRPCHTYIHENPAESREKGWLK